MFGRSTEVSHGDGRDWVVPQEMMVVKQFQILGPQSDEELVAMPVGKGSLKKVITVPSFHTIIICFVEIYIPTGSVYVI